VADLVPRFVAVVAALVAGCASIQINESIVDTPTEPAVRQETVDGSLAYTVDAEVRGELISLRIQQSETCATITTQRAHRVKWVTRVADPTAVRMTWLLAAVGLGLGGYSYGDAAGLAARENQRSMDSVATPDDYRAYGVGLAAVGLVATTLVAVNAVRSTDYQVDGGVIEGEARRKDRICRQHPTRRKEVVLVLANAHRVVARLDERGQADFTLLPVPANGIPDGGTPIAAHIGDARIPIELSFEHRDQLRASLLANPRSQLAIDVLTKRKAECAQMVAVAQAATNGIVDDDPDAVSSSWVVAKSTCNELWTAEMDVLFADAQVKVGVARCHQRLVRAAGSLQDEMDTDSIESITADLAAVRAVCFSAPQLEQLRALEVRLGAINKQVAIERHREEVREQQRLAREQRSLRQEAAAERRREQTYRLQLRQPSRSCCKQCSKGKACGDSCISRSKSCNVGRGCACD